MAPILRYVLQFFHGGEQIWPGLCPNLRIGPLAVIPRRESKIFLSGREFAADPGFAVAARITTVPAPVIQPDRGEAVCTVGRIGAIQRQSLITESRRDLVGAP